MLKKVILLLFLSCFFCSTQAWSKGEATHSPSHKTEKAVAKRSHRKTVKATGVSGRRVEEAKKERRKSTSGYRRWKMKLPFWWRKLVLLIELASFITIGVLFAQILEVSGLVKYLSILAWPIIKLGGLKKETAPAFLASFQSGALANTMLVSSRDDGSIDNRELYTSVYVVSALSLFAHLPSFVVPIGAAFGWKATLIMFAVRFGAILAQIVFVLVMSNLIVGPWMKRRGIVLETEVVPDKGEVKNRKKRGDDDASFVKKVWKRSRRTLKRLLIFLIPTYLILSALEYSGFFKWLASAFPSIFQWSFLPSQSAAIIPAQAVNMYNGAIAAANFIDSGAMSVKQAVLIILVGSVITAPFRTMKHALPTYMVVLGPKAGLVMAITAQVMRSVFLIAATVVMWLLW